MKRVAAVVELVRDGGDPPWWTVGHLNVNGRPRGQARSGEDAPCGGCVSVANCRARVVACELVAGM